MDAPVVPYSGERNELPELAVVGAGGEEDLMPRCPAGDVIEPVGKARSSRSRHPFDGTAAMGPIRA